mmetsp:Transcript_12921/g.28100  ORF Transcript_12921/g.28100 Transcript_12921/m.28100 type:complete len:206 (+) Transcript_12921:469-1086(+)
MCPDLSLSMPKKSSSTRFSSTSGDNSRKAAISSLNVIVPVSSVSAFKKISRSLPTSPLSMVLAMVINIVFFMNPNFVYLSISSMSIFSFSCSVMGPSAFLALTTFRTWFLMCFALASLSKDAGGSPSSLFSANNDERLLWLPASLFSSSSLSLSPGKSCGCTNSGFIFFFISARHASQIRSTSGAHPFCKYSKACLAVQRSFGSI